jgi:predicted metal-dependent hydrolase
MPVAARARALEAGLAAYARGDFFLAHELLEPAWMGSQDLAERDLLQGVIKVAAAQVHAVRGNAAGVRKNLAGARDLLAAAADATGARFGLDPAGLVATIDARLAGRISVEDEPVLIRRRDPTG